METKLVKCVFLELSYDCMLALVRNYIHKSKFALWAGLTVDLHDCTKTD